MSSRLSKLDHRKLFVRTRFSYEKLPGGDSQNGSPFTAPIRFRWRNRSSGSDRYWHWPRLSLTKFVLLVAIMFLTVSLMGTGMYRRHKLGEGRKKGQKELKH